MARPKYRTLDRVWRQRIQRQASSGLSMAAFCRRAGVLPPAHSTKLERTAQGSATFRLSPATPISFASHRIRSPANSALFLAMALRWSYPTKCDFAFTHRPSPNGWAALWPYSLAFHTRRPRDDHAPLSHQDLSLHAAHRLAQELRWPHRSGSRSASARTRLPAISSSSSIAAGIESRSFTLTANWLAIWYKRLEAGSFQTPPNFDPDGVELQP